MEIFVAIFGFIAGVAGGMGMGGGTLLVPLLSFLDIKQHTIQSINLLSFLPMCLIALNVHSKNGLIKKNGTLKLIVPASIGAVIGSIFTSFADEKVLKICFGVFFILLAFWQLLCAIAEYKKR